MVEGLGRETRSARGRARRVGSRGPRATPARALGTAAWGWGGGSPPAGWPGGTRPLSGPGLSARGDAREQQDVVGIGGEDRVCVEVRLRREAVEVLRAVGSPPRTAHHRDDGQG